MLSRREATAEGFVSAEEFDAAWRSINGSYDAGAIVWRIEFEVARIREMPDPGMSNPGDWCSHETYEQYNAGCDCPEPPCPSCGAECNPGDEECWRCGA